MLLRVDLNVPVQGGQVADASRIERLVPTITEIADKGGKVILLSHYGRPKGRDPKNSLKPVAAAAAQVIGRPIGFAEDCVGEVAEKAVAAMKPGDIVCLENTRFPSAARPRTIRHLPRKLAPARRHLCRRRILGRPSRPRFGRRPWPSAAGLCRARHGGRARRARTRRFNAPERPVAAIVGGAKISTKTRICSATSSRNSRR